jgi:hypothetical protein
MADFAAPTPEDDQQPAATEPAGIPVSEATIVEAARPATEPAEPPAAEPADGQVEAPPEAAPATETAPASEQADTPVARTEPEPAAVLDMPEAIRPEVTAPEAAATETVASLEPSVSQEPAAVSPPAAAETPAPINVAAVPAIDAPSIASTIEVPASAPNGADGEGGEWELLVQKVSSWLRSGQLEQQWQTARKPLSLLAGLIALLLVLRIYSALLGVLESLPLIPGLLELVGVIAVARFSLTRLVRSNERQQLIQGLQQRWKSFRGQG